MIHELKLYSSSMRLQWSVQNSNHSLNVTYMYYVIIVITRSHFVTSYTLIQVTTMSDDSPSELLINVKGILLFCTMGVITDCVTL